MIEAITGRQNTCVRLGHLEENTKDGVASCHLEGRAEEAGLEIRKRQRCPIAILLQGTCEGLFISRYLQTYGLTFVD